MTAGSLLIRKRVGSSRQVLEFEFGPQAYRAFRFAAESGVNLAPNLGREDAIHLRFRVDPRNRGENDIALVFEDQTDWSRASDGSADLSFRVAWSIPAELQDGRWYEGSIPLPPSSWQELENARAAGQLSGLAAHWNYVGATSPAGFRVAGDNLGPGTSERPELWQEFEWTNVQSFGIAWNGNEEGGPVWIDYIYLGQPELDLKGFGGMVAPASKVTVRRGFYANTISWKDVLSAGGYNVYVSEQAISDVADRDVFLLQRIRHGTESRAISHQLEVPRASAALSELYYAVTSLSRFGVENPDVSTSTATVHRLSPIVSPAIVELTDDESRQLAENLAAGVAARDGFPRWQEPFRINRQHSSVGEGGSVVVSDEDLSGRIWVGQSPQNELYVYAEIIDDVVRLAPDGVDPADAWQYDSFELGLGNYDVRDVHGGSVLTGSPHQAMERGKHADYLLRVSAHGDGKTAFAWVGSSLNSPVPGSTAIFGLLKDAAGNGIGWKALAVFPLGYIQNLDTRDAVLEPVTGSEQRLVPMNIGLNDADESGLRDSQIHWSTKRNADGNWWHTPAQWPVVAITGRLTWTGRTDEEVDVPVTYSLLQNYPNPFNPATTIAFTLASDEPVTLTVFDALGRRVVTLLDNERMASGRHHVRFDARDLASGVYFYQLRAGDSYMESRRMLVVK